MAIFRGQALIFLLSLFALTTNPGISSFMLSHASTATPLDHEAVHQRGLGCNQTPLPAVPKNDGPTVSHGGERVVRVGIYENKPKVYIRENGKPAGIFIGILEEIARRENWRVVYVPCSWPSCLNALDRGGIDLMPDIALSPERSEKFDFNRVEVIESWSQVYARDRQPDYNWRDLNKKKIAMLKDSIQIPVLEQMLNGFGYTVTIIETDSFDEAFALAAKGSVDAVVANHFFGGYYYREYGLEKTSIVFNPVPLYFATTRGANPDLLDAIDRNLRVMKSEPGSVYYTELARWLDKPPRVIVPRYLVWGLGGVAGMLALAFVLILLLRGQVRNRTEHLVQANRTLRESEEKFRAIFQNHSVVKLIVDPDSGVIVEANQAAAAFYGWSEETLRRMRIQDIDIIPPDQVEAEIKRAKNNETNFFECRHRLADGSIRNVELFSSGIDIRGKKRLHFIIHDITEHRRLEEQYRQAQKMEAIGRLAGGVAHDYNNFLNVIIGYSELALLKLEAEDPLREYLKQIYTAAERSRGITRQLLSFARREAITPETIDINAAVDDLFEILRQLVGEDVEIIWKPGKDLWPVLMDVSQFGQILTNLMVNARDAITDVGKIVLETKALSFDKAYCSKNAGCEPGDFVLLSVNDDGCGMTREILDKIFDPFFSTKKVNQGTGLGLATVYGIVKQNKGFILVDSHPGQGSTFSVYLPRCKDEVQEQQGVLPEQVRLGAGQTVLVVEDNASILTLIEKALTKFNYRVLTAAMPSAAIRLAEKYADEISLLITDVVMPEMNGRELADKIMSFCPGIKCLYMSGYSGNIIVHREVFDDDFFFIDKPFSVTDLVNKVGTVLYKSGTDHMERK